MASKRHINLSHSAVSAGTTNASGKAGRSGTTDAAAQVPAPSRTITPRGAASLLPAKSGRTSF